MNVTPALIARAFADRTHYVEVSHAVLEGQPWAVFTAFLIGTDGDTAYYTTDGVWYSKATNDQYTSWRVIGAPDATPSQRAAATADLSAPRYCTETYRAHRAQACACYGSPVGARAQLPTWEEEFEGVGPLPHTMGWYSPEGEPLSPHYGTPFGVPTSHPVSALTLSMAPMVPVSAARDSSNPVIDRAAYETPEVIAEWIAEAHADAPIRKADGFWRSATALDAQYARTGAYGDCAPDCAERDTCPTPGAVGHSQCGHCPTHGAPVHHCPCPVN